ncbi:MAG: UDP-N-acetylglucosamine--N-acetylmuramyl-(pentapeptide) pyrophosphoryl-undecaprenol N-acetylglucosamine transferase [Planctomycetota bacterium]|nr:UDP-N-acetylglucosamine--N-acetylmuramyl-(pentapeptide) pyrophosphoryl-undecaprenol N-acetylglucosamine transferase [Planctomycetota bacterium]
MSEPIYIFAGGGTGGHIIPGLAVAKALRACRPTAKIIFACSNRPIDRQILDAQRCGVVTQPIRPLPSLKKPWCIVGFLLAWGRSSALSRDMVRDLKPAAVLGLGGFAAAAVVRQAARAGVRSGLLNCDAVPGKANQYLARRANVIFTQFRSTKDCFPPPVRRKVRHVGCPIRAGLADGDRAEAMRHFDLRPDRKTLLVFGGSLLAESVGDSLAALADDLAPLAETWQVLHVAKNKQMQAPFCRTIEYCRRMDLAYAAADLALCRAGAVTVAELAATATPAVLMPYPYHADRHQKLNAAGLARAGAAIVCEDSGNIAVNAARLRDILPPIMKDEKRLDTMRQAAAAEAKADAAEQVAKWLM